MKGGNTFILLPYLELYSYGSWLGCSSHTNPPKRNREVNHQQMTTMLPLALKNFSGDGILILNLDLMICIGA